MDCPVETGDGEMTIQVAAVEDPPDAEVARAEFVRARHREILLLRQR